MKYQWEVYEGSKRRRGEGGSRIDGVGVEGVGRVPADDVALDLVPGDPGHDLREWVSRSDHCRGKHKGRSAGGKRMGGDGGVLDWPCLLSG